MSEVSPDHGVGCCCMFPNVIDPACKCSNRTGDIACCFVVDDGVTFAIFLVGNAQ